MLMVTSSDGKANSSNYNQIVNKHDGQ